MKRPILLILAFFCFYATGFTQIDQISIDGPLLLCEGDCGQYTVITTPSSGMSLSYQWSNGTTQNVAVVCAPGVLSVTVTDNNGAAYTDSIFIQSAPNVPVQILSTNDNTCPDSISQCERVCPNTTVTYFLANNSNPPGGVLGGAQWSVFGSTDFSISPDGRSVTVNWGEPGNGSVTVVTGTQGGCIGEASLCVNIIEEPISAFGSLPAAVADTLEVCASQLVFFQNQSQYSDIFQWFFTDDNSASSTANPQHQFNVPGLHEIILVAQSACVCSDTSRLMVRVLPTEPSDLDCIGTICPGEVVTYRANTTCPISNWSVTNGTILGGGSPGVDSITVQWNNGPAGQIIYELENCSGAACPLPVVFNVPVIDDLPEIDGPAEVCTNERATYRIQAFAGSEYIWTLSGGGNIIQGQGTNEIVVEWGSFANPNLTRWITVSYENCYLGCGGEDSLGVRVLPSFVINGPVDVCLGNSGDFIARFIPSGGNIPCNWRLFDPNGAVVWTSPTPAAIVNIPFNSGPGQYRLLAVPENPGDVCTQEAQWTIQVASVPTRPTAIEGPTMVCANTPFTYTATGLPQGSSIRWTIQDGANTTTQTGNPVNAVFSGTPPYSLTAVQISTDGFGCASDTAFYEVMPIMPLPISGVDRHCTEVVGFFEAKFIPNVTYNWSVNPPESGALQGGTGSNGIRIYWKQPGPAEVVLEVCGEVSTFPVNVSTGTSAMVDLPTQVCAGGVDTAEVLTTYLSNIWYDDQENILSDTTFAVLGPGNYIVQLIDVNGCPSSQEFEIEEKPTPNVSLSTSDPTGFCNNSETVTMQALVNSNDNYMFEWFQDGVPLGVNAPSYSTNQYSNYTVQVTNSFGCTAISEPITLFSYCGGGSVFFPSQGAACPPGEVDLAVNPFGVCNVFDFSVVPNGPLYVPGSASWTIGTSGGQILDMANGDNIIQAFPNAGIYIVQADVQLTNGAVCSLVDSVRVEAVANFIPDPACIGDSTFFEDHSSTLPNVSITNWSWNFNDPASGADSTSTLQNPAHVYSDNTNPYQVSLTITASNGCTSTYTESVEVFGPTPAPIIGVYPRCADLASPIPAAVNDLIAVVDWDFGDPPTGVNNSASGPLVYHQYEVPGFYWITATATNVYGCVSVDSLEIEIGANNLTGEITLSNPSPICQGQSITLTAPTGSFYGWSTNEPTDTLLVTESGTYTVTVSNSFGCTWVPMPVVVDVIDQPNVTVKGLQTNALGQVIGTVDSPLAVCEGEDVVLRATGQGTYTYEWSNGVTGTTNILGEIRNNQLPPGSHTFTVVATDPLTGCTAESAVFEVIVNPRPDSISITASGICAGQANVLEYSGVVQPDWSLQWNTGVDGPILTTEQAGRYFLRVTNSLGCSIESNRITVFPEPPVQTLPDGCLTQCIPDTLCVPDLPGIVSWQWFLNGAPLPNGTDPELVPEESGQYFAVLTDARGCSAQSTTVDLTVLDGFGQVAGQVWADVNSNGVIDPLIDTIIADFPVVLNLNGNIQDTTATNNIGNFVFPNVPANTYTAELDTTLFPPGWRIVIGVDSATLIGCGAEALVGLLVSQEPCFAEFDTLQVAVCQGSSYDFNGTMIPAGSSQTFSFTSLLGCDSTVTVEVGTLLPSFAVLDTFACKGGNVIFGNDTIPAGDSIVITLSNFQGCDSTVTVRANELPPPVIALDTVACENESVVIGLDTIPAGQSAMVEFTPADSCHYVLDVSVDPLPTQSTVVDSTACQGGFVLFNGVPIPAGMTAVFDYQTFQGCDSTVTVNVASEVPPFSNLDVMVCPGDSFMYLGFKLPPGETTAITVSDLDGCDSIVSISVDTFMNLVQTIDTTACEGDTVVINGTPIPAGGSEIFVVPSFAGCDSTIIVNVAITPSSSDTILGSACSGDFYVHLDSTAVVPAGDTLVLSYTNFQGCDSIVTIIVEELLPSTTAEDQLICENDSVVYQGNTYFPGDSYVKALTNGVGCDSTVTVSVRGESPPFSVLEVDICPNTFFEYNGASYPPDTIAEIIFQKSEGCDSTVTLIVNGYPEVTYDLSVSSPCPDVSDGSLSIENLSGGTPPFQYSINGGTVQDSSLFEGLAPGAYVVRVEDVNGCAYTADTILTSRARLQIELDDVILPCDSPAVRLEPLVFGDTTVLQWLWSDGSTLPYLFVDMPGPVTVEVSNICESISERALVRISAIEGGEEFYYVPNTFQPMGPDALNSLFRVFFPGNTEVITFELSIYDRWGNLMFLTEDFTAGWDGHFNGDMMDPAVFVWKLEAEVAFCGRVFEISRYGDVTIVR